MTSTKSASSVRIFLVDLTNRAGRTWTKKISVSARVDSVATHIQDIYESDRIKTRIVKEIA